MKTNNLMYVLDIQLFNEDDDKETELSLDDFESEDEEENQEEENSDKKEDSQEEEEKKKQSRRQNAAEARKRREREQKEAIEKAAKEAYEKGLLEGKKGALKINTFTGEPIEDDIDVSDFELMQKLKEEGKDPIKDFQKAKAKLERERKSKEAEEEKRKKEESDKKAKILEDEKKDREDFIKTVGSKEKAIETFKDPNFKLFSKGRIGKEPLTEIYKDYVSFTQKFSSVETKNPQLPRQGAGGGDGKVDTKSMSYAEYDAYFRKKYNG